MAKLSEERKEYLKNYKKTKLKRVPLELSIDDYTNLQIHAALNNESVNGYIKRVIKESIKQENDLKPPEEIKRSRVLAALANINSQPQTK